MFSDTGEHPVNGDVFGQIRLMLKTQQEDLRDLKAKLDKLILLEERAGYQEKRIEEIRGEMERVQEELAKWRTVRTVGGWVLGGGGVVSAFVTAYFLRHFNP